MLSQFIRFCGVGLIYTSIDFIIYNILMSHRLRLTRLSANCISSSIALILNFSANFCLVFKPEEAPLAPRIVRHLLVTCFSTFVLQNLIIWLMSTYSCMLPRNRFMAHTTEGHQTMPIRLLDRNIVKACAVGVGLLWNFVWYRFFVFQ